MLYPNPVAGSGVKVLPPAYAGTADVRIEVLTVTFRKVLDQTFPDVPAGTAVTVPLDDSWGHPLADGLYYVVVEVNGKKTIAELLILR